jgi:glycosyltransferase involved in cell wall biosynthesis
MRLIFINRFFFPDESATSLMLTDLVEGLAPLGLDMRVITAAASYTDTGAPAHALPFPNLTIVRLPGLPVSNQSLAGRVLNFLAFYCGLLVAGLRHVRRGDLVICLTDPPFVGVLATLLARIRKARVVHWVQDIYPETATRLGYGSASNPLIRLLVRLRDWAWANAARNVVIGERMRDMLLARGIAARTVRVIPNWADDGELRPLAPEQNALREAWGFTADTLVIGYSGNLGRAHDADTMLEAAQLLAGEQSGRIRFLFIGGGAKHASLAAAKADAVRSAMLVWQSYRPRSELLESLNVPDVHWLSLEPELEGLIVPSKFYGAAAVGKPIIFIGDTDGEIARLIRMAGCGASFAKGDSEGVAVYIAQLAADPDLRLRLGTNARQFCEAQLTRKARLQDWRALVTELRIMGRPYRSG